MVPACGVRENENVGEVGGRGELAVRGCRDCGGVCEEPGEGVAHVCGRGGESNFGPEAVVGYHGKQTVVSGRGQWFEVRARKGRRTLSARRTRPGWNIRGRRVSRSGGRLR